MPIDFIVWLSFIVVGGSVLAGVSQIVLRFLYPDIAPRGFTTLIILILFMGGVQLLSLSVIAEYIAKMFLEVKGRPRYIVKKMVNMP